MPPERKVPLAALKLMELEYKQRQEVEALKELNKKFNPKQSPLSPREQAVMTNRYANYNSSQTVGLPVIGPMSPGNIQPINPNILPNGGSHNTPAYFTFENGERI